MKNKNKGMILLLVFGIMTLIDWITKTNFEDMTGVQWFLTFVMIVLYLGGLLLIMKDEE